VFASAGAGAIAEVSAKADDKANDQNRSVRTGGVSKSAPIHAAILYTVSFAEEP
jgi:hypothetical protein